MYYFRPMPSTAFGPSLFNLTLDGDVTRVAVAGAAAEEVARGLGISPLSAVRIRSLVESLAADASMRLTVHAEEPVTLDAELDGTLLRFTLRDQGSPIDHASLPGFVTGLLDAGVAEVLRVEPPGPLGNCIAIDIALPAHRELVAGDDRIDVDERAPEDEEIEIRRMRPDEALALSKGIHSCYGYTYPDLVYYFPERLAVRIASPDWYSYVAVNPEGVIVAHMQQDFRDEGRILHGGGAFTDPRYRGRKLQARFTALAMEDFIARDPGPVVRLSEAVTTHPITQRMGLSEGQIECGIFLAWGAPRRQEGFNEEVADLKRSSVRPGIMLLQPTEHRVLHPPAFVADYVRRVVEQHDLPRTIDTPRPRSFADAPDHTMRVVEVDRESESASITVSTVGRDLTDVVLGDLEALQRQAVYVQLQLPAGDPTLSIAAAGLDELGFVFCALLPDYRSSGDELRLQWLPEAEFDPDALVLHTDFLKELVADVIEDVRAAKNRDSEQRRRRASTRRILAALD